MPPRANQWIVGANGVYCGTPATGFARLGAFDFATNAVMRGRDGLVVGVSCGVFHVDEEDGRWKQLHDETLTEVLAVAPHPSGMVVGCPYGLATARTTDNVVRWAFLSNSLGVNHRFTTALLPLGPVGGDIEGGTPGANADAAAAPAAAAARADYLVGTEGGLLCARAVPEAPGGWEACDPPEIRWEITSIPSVPVRAVIRAGETYFAGTDGRGVWSSRDGAIWRPAGRGADDRSVYSLAFDGTSIVGGTERGLIVGDGSGTWASVGPGVLAAAVGADRRQPGHWLVGTRPAGLWWTEDGGRRFRQIGGFPAVGAVLGPEEKG